MKLHHGIFLFGASMKEKTKRGVGISPTSMDRKNDGPFRMCVATHAMLARNQQRRKPPVKMTKNETEQNTYIDENSVGT